MKNFLLKHFKNKYKSVLLLDALGAFTSALLIGMVLTRLETELSAHILYSLSGLATALGLFSLCNFIKPSKYWEETFIAAVMLNTSYVVLTSSILVHFNHLISDFGKRYFFLEIALILLLIGLELRIYLLGIKRRLRKAEKKGIKKVISQREITLDYIK